MPIFLPVAGISIRICVLTGAWLTHARKACAPWMRPAAVLLAGLPAHAEGGRLIVLVADSRRYSGLKAWWANVYNESHFGFALATIVVIPLLGLLMGKLTGLVLSRMGINLKSRVLAEH